MSYFPAFININDKKILILGGGNIANNKLRSLISFSSNITLISKEFSLEFEKFAKEHNLKIIKKEYEKEDIKGFDIVIATINNIQIQEEIYFETRKYRCLYNCSDIPEYCDFIFPSYIKKDNLTIAISSNGGSPAVIKQLRIYLEKLIPSDIGVFIKQMQDYRTSMPKGSERMKFLEQKAKEYFSNLK